MAITDLGQLASGGGRTANQSTLTTGITASVAAGELIVAVVAVDNSQTQLDFSDSSVSSVVIGGTLTLSKLHSSGPATVAQTGPGLSVWWGVAPSAIAFAQNIVVTFANAATSDHSALIARHFSISTAGIQPTNAFRQYVDTATDPPAIDVTTPNATYLRIRAIGSRRDGAVSSNAFSITSGWPASQQVSSGAQLSSPDWEIYAYYEFVIATGTSKVSDPTATFASVHANVYVVFQENPITGTLAATEGQGDVASFPGGVNVNYGTIEAYEGADWLTADSEALKADDNITRVNTAGMYRDAAAFSGQVLTGPIGVIAATEAADTASFAGKVGLIGTLAATDVADTAAFVGTVVWPVITATLAATEASDTALFGGFGQGFGTLAATEARDTAAFTGGVVVAGALAATEVGDDTADFHGVITNAGTLDAVEVGDDTAAFTGFAYVAVTLAATEGADIPAFTGYTALLDEKVGTLIAHEDRVGGYSEPRADSTLVTADDTLFHASIDYFGQDRALFTADVVVGAVIAAVEGSELGVLEPTADSTLYTADQTIFTVDRDQHAERADFSGEVRVGAVLAAFEGSDAASFEASSRGIAVLDAKEVGLDTAAFRGFVGDLKGVLAAREGADTAYFSVAKWEMVEPGAGLENELLRMVWLAGQGGRVTWLENEVEDTSELQNISPEVISLTAEQRRIMELRP